MRTDCPAYLVVRFCCGLSLLWSVASVSHAQTPTENGSVPTEGTVAVGSSGLVELHVADMSLSTALRMLSVQSRRNIIATPAVQGTVTTDLYQVPFERALKAVLAANNCDYREQGEFIYVYTNDELQAASTGTRTVNSRVFRLNYVRAADVVPMLEPLLSAEGKIVQPPVVETSLDSAGESESGGDVMAADEFFVVYDYSDRIAKVAILLKDIDIRPRQVLVEATILRARLNESNALGIDFSLVGGVDLELLGSTSQGIQNLVFGQLPQNRFEQFNSNLSTSFANNVPDGGLTFGVIKDHVAVFIRALEEITDTSVMANPKVLAVNKQVGDIIVGRRDGYITTTVTETQAVQTVEFLETGTQLTFRPFIYDDDYIRMELHPKDSVGGLTAAQLPFEQTTEVTTNVIVRDGHTILIGGLFREASTASRSQVPFLGNLQAVGDLFRSRDDSLDREEVVILLTVYVIKDEELYADRSRELREDIERARVGIRNGMMWHGRERLAEHHYKRALDRFSKQDMESALWHAEMALHNNPRSLTTIRLREDILQERAWDDDGAINRNFVTRLIMDDSGVDHSPFGRPTAGGVLMETPNSSTSVEGETDR